MRTDHKSLQALRSYEQTLESQLINVSHLVCNTNAPDDACTEIISFNNDGACSEIVSFNNSHTKTNSSLVDTRDQKENKEGNNSILPLLNTATTGKWKHWTWQDADTDVNSDPDANSDPDTKIFFKHEACSKHFTSELH